MKLPHPTIGALVGAALVFTAIGALIGWNGVRFVPHDDKPSPTSSSSTYQAPIIPAINREQLPERAPVIMREPRIQCLAAILTKTPHQNWDLILHEMPSNPNVCLFAGFLFSGDIPELNKLPQRERELASRAIDHE